LYKNLAIKPKACHDFNPKPTCKLTEISFFNNYFCLFLQVFGALTSCSLHVSDHFYGTGESLLYKFNPSFKVFHWTGENMYFIKGNMESLSIGAGE